MTPPSTKMLHRARAVAGVAHPGGILHKKGIVCCAKVWRARARAVPKPQNARRTNFLAPLAARAWRPRRPSPRRAADPAPPFQAHEQRDLQSSRVDVVHLQVREGAAPCQLHEDWVRGLGKRSSSGAEFHDDCLIAAFFCFATWALEDISARNEGRPMRNCWAM